MNPRTMGGTTRERLGIVAAGVIMMTAALAPASALAASGSASATPADTSTGVQTITLALSDGTLCTSRWQGTGSGPGILGDGGSSEVEWTANRCGFSIQERSWCEAIDNSAGEWINSGVVVREGLWDGSSCPTSGFETKITRGEVRFKDGLGNWGQYHTFWTP